MAKRKMKKMELMLAITMPMCLTLTILVITKNDLSGTDGEDDLNKSQKKITDEFILCGALIVLYSKS